MAVVKARDPVTGEWLPIDQPGPAGPTGPTGTLGPTGPVGPVGPADLSTREVILGPTRPDTVALPAAEVWYDTTQPDPPNTSLFPPGGTAEQSLTIGPSGKTEWRGPNLKLTGGTITGNLNITGNLGVGGKLTSPTVAGNVWFNNDITAASVEDRTAYEWEEWNAALHLNPEWSQGDSIGPTKVWRNRYAVLVNMDIRRQDSDIDLGTEFPFHTWLDVLADPIPVGWRPPTVLWDTFHAVELTWQAPLFQIRLRADGQISVWAHGEWKWQRNSKIPIYFCYPRPPE